MATLRVRTPVPDYSGSVGAVHFSGGQGLADTELHAAEIAYFHARGYVVEEFVEEPEDKPEPAAELEPEGDADEDVEDAPVPPPAKNAATAAWQTWAVEHGGLSEEDAAAMTRDQLVERFANSEENA